jgi:hypothetical protein
MMRRMEEIGHNKIMYTSSKNEHINRALIRCQAR